MNEPASATVSNAPSTSTGAVGHGVEELSVACNLCGADDYEVLFEPGEAQIARIVSCHQCGLMYANPRGRPPDHEEIEGYDPEWNLVERDPMRLDKQRLQVRDYAATRRHLAELHPHRGKLLEVGSGLGFLLDYFRQDGWQPTGVEPFLEGCEYTKRSFGIHAIQATLENAGIEDESMDVVLMMHVIEHLPDPSRTLSEIYRILKPGGHFVMETPRYDTLMFRVLGRRERSLSCDGHIYFFTTETLRRMYEKAGFSLVNRRRVGRSLTMGRLLWNVNVVGRLNLSDDVLDSLSDRLHLDKLKFHLNLRDMERLVLVK